MKCRYLMKLADLNGQITFYLDISLRHSNIFLSFLFKSYRDRREGNFGLNNGMENNFIIILLSNEKLQPPSCHKHWSSLWELEQYVNSKHSYVIHKNKRISAVSNMILYQQYYSISHFFYIIQLQCLGQFGCPSI